MDDNRRQHERFDVSLEVEVTGPNGLTAMGTTRNLSDGGVLLTVQLDPPPPVGAELAARVISPEGDADPPTISVRVARVTRDGLALAFLPRD